VEQCLFYRTLLVQIDPASCIRADAGWGGQCSSGCICLLSTRCPTLSDTFVLLQDSRSGALSKDDDNMNDYAYKRIRLQAKVRQVMRSPAVGRSSPVRCESSHSGRSCRISLLKQQLDVLILYLIFPHPQLVGDPLNAQLEVT
jgi:hypothetical protein